ncbi:MAG TPA: hypothetical protein VGC89_12470 [Pyrinomonadaceae bacterium]
MQRKRLARGAGLVMLLSSLLLTSGCASLFGVKQKVKVPPLLTPLTNAGTSQLINEVNRLASVRSMRGKIDIQFQDTSFAESGLAEKYRTADGTVYLQRPGQIYLKIQAPFVGTNIAEMTSDGERFRVAVLQGDEKFRRFVSGTNSAPYKQLSMDDAAAAANKNNRAMNDKRAVSVLSNLRPQHFTDALLIRPILPRAESGLVYARSEAYEEEADTRDRAKKGARVVRGYYVLDELSPGGETGARLLRRFWFDRVGGIRLARLQTYDTNGSLMTDVVYSEPKSFGENAGLTLPSRIEITRPQDLYKLSVTYQAPESVVIDKQYEPTVFVLENKWQLPEVDLDTKNSGK